MFLLSKGRKQGYPLESGINRIKLLVKLVYHRTTMVTIEEFVVDNRGL